MGGLQRLIFKSVRDIPTNSNYSKFIEPISMLQSIIRGNPTWLRQPVMRDVRYLFHLMVDIIGINKYESIGNSFTNFGIKKFEQKPKPLFITNLFKHFVVNVEEIRFELDNMFHATFGSTQFGYKVFQPLLFNSRGSKLNISLLVALFSNLKRFILFHQPRNDYIPSINLDDEFLMDILGAISVVQERNTKLTLEYFVITYPKDPVSDFIDTNSDKFTALNWRLYSDSWRHSFWGKCDNCLYIAPK